MSTLSTLSIDTFRFSFIVSFNVCYTFCSRTLFVDVRLLFCVLLGRLVSLASGPLRGLKVVKESHAFPAGVRVVLWPLWLDRTHQEGRLRSRRGRLNLEGSVLTVNTWRGWRG